MIDFSTLKELTVPEGVVMKITDASGMVLWQLQGESSENIILEVEKITSDTYANNTTYSNEQFVLLDIYPKTNGTVNVTYGGLTKTITDTSGAEEPSEQRVFFGTFNGVSDEVETPASGTLTIEGDWVNFSTATFNPSKTTSDYCGCITGVKNWGGITSIGTGAFAHCTSLALTELPSGITSIGTGAFTYCTSLALTELPSGITSIGFNTFYNCTSLALTELPSGITSIGTGAFYGCTNIKNITIPTGVTTIDKQAFYLASGQSRTITMLSATPATLTTDTVFDELGTNNIIVPHGSGATYKAAEYWSKYADYIMEVSA